MVLRKYRYIILAVMTALTAFCLTLFPRININEDMTRYLPDDSRMKQGVDSLKVHFPEIDMNAYFVKAMFRDVEDRVSLAEELSNVEGVAGITSVEEKDGYVLYQLSVEDGAEPKAISSAITGRYGDSVIVEHNANSIMPDNMVMILIVGAAIVFGILFLMCSSFVEALLFILAIGMAVVMNIGTNALLPSVSMMTNTIVAVLQLVLSMDYSIILMNRFRQTLQDEPDIDKAMGIALKSASPSILSSGLTTIVGLLALIFMKFKIGMDLGVVLSKGVFFSLVSTYTILPALILIFYAAIRKTEKRVFLIPTDGLAKSEYAFRIPLAIVFLLLFGLSWHLSGKTELSYASIWQSRINEVFPPKNNFSLVYRTSSEDTVPSLMDSLDRDQNIFMTISYPSLFRREMTAGDMCENIKSLIALLPNIPGAEIPDIPLDGNILAKETLQVLYYAASHPVRDEKMSFEDMIQLGDEVSKSGMLPDGVLPEGMDVEAIVRKFTTPEKEVAKSSGQGTPADVVVVIPEKREEPVAPEIVVAEAVADSVAEEKQEPAEAAARFTREELNTPMNADQIAEYLGFSKSQASAAFSMAKKRNGTMTPDEFIGYMINKVLRNKFLRGMISDSQAESLYSIRKEMDQVLAVESVPDTVAVPAADSLDTSLLSDEKVEIAVAPSAPSAAERHLENTPEPTPMERLAEMFASGRRYSVGQIYRSLHRAGIDVVDEGTLNLMFMYYGSRNSYNDTTRMSLDGIIDFLSEKVAVDDDYSVFLDDSTRTMLGGLRSMVDEGTRMLRKEEWSMAAVVTDYPIESEETFDFVEKTLSECDEILGPGNYYLVGESVLYKEMKDGFRKELLYLTLLTIVSIFLIVALTFKSMIVPTILVMIVMTGVNVNVFFSGTGGHTMLYLAYLIVQSILMGATIDYGILFTNFYLTSRRQGQSVVDALKKAYGGSIHTIMTSGLIIILAPLIMSELLTDPTICSILSSLTFGALSVILLIILVLPALLAVTDRLIIRKK